MRIPLTVVRVLAVIGLAWSSLSTLSAAEKLSLSSLFTDHAVLQRDIAAPIWGWAKPGDKLTVIEPAGKFLPVFDPPGKHLICIAGGSGVTPFRAFAREATRRQLATRITILYSVRTTNDIIFRQEFQQLEQENEHFDFYVTCTRLHPDDPWSGRRGRISAEWVREHIHDPANTVFYACGTNELVEATEQLVLDELKLPKEQMKTEKWG